MPFEQRQSHEEESSREQSLQAFKEALAKLETILPREQVVALLKTELDRVQSPKAQAEKPALQPTKTQPASTEEMPPTELMDVGGKGFKLRVAMPKSEIKAASSIETSTISPQQKPSAPAETKTEVQAIKKE